MSKKTLTDESVLPRALLAVHGALVALRYAVSQRRPAEEVERAVQGICTLCDGLGAARREGVDAAVSSLAALSTDFRPALSLYRLEDPRIAQEVRSQIANPDVTLLRRLACAMDEAAKALTRIAHAGNWQAVAEISDTLEPLPWMALRRQEASCREALSDLAQRVPGTEPVLDAYERDD